MQTIGLMILAGAFLVASHFPPWTAFQQEVVAASGAAILAYAALRSGQVRRWPAIAVGVAALACVPLLQWLVGQLLFWADAVLATLYLLSFALAIVIGAAAGRAHGERFIDALTGALAVAAVLSAALAMAQLLQVPLPPFDVMPLQPGGRPYGNLAQPNHLATLLLLGLVSVAWHVERGHLGRLSATLLLTVLVVALAATQSRTVAVAAVMLCVWAVAAHRRCGTRTKAATVIAVAIACVLLALSWPTVVETLLYQTAGRDLAGMTEQGLRPKHWRAFAAAMAMAPWFGYGWNQVSVAQGEVAASQPHIGEMVDHSHNLAIDLLLWNGAVLGLLVVIGLTWWLWRHLREARTPSEAFLLAALLVVITHAMLEYPLSYAYFLIPFGLIVGVLEALRPIGRPVSVPTAASASLAGLCVLVTAMIAVDYVGIDDDFRRLRLETLGLAHPQSAADVPTARVVNHWREFLVFARTPARIGMSAEELSRMRRVYRRFPQPPVLLRFAIAAGLNGHVDEAGEALLRLCKIHPIKRCEEGREAWESMARDQYPQLAAIAFPVGR